MLSHNQRPTLAAFYLPQFHQTPENDEFWGPGFTDWHNVMRARPRFRGHAQPKVPADLGLYDLRDIEAQAAQIALARAYGIGAFCYYHYWFDGRVVLGEPLQSVLAEPALDLPFFICWANESWTRRWDGRGGEILLEQRYSPSDDLAHIRSLLPALSDPRYYRVDGCPVLLVYRARLLPNPAATADRWRSEASRAGIGDIHLCAVESFAVEHADPAAIGFDASVEFQPDWSELVAPEGRTWWREFASRRLNRSSFWLENAVYSYDAVVDVMVSKPDPGYLRYPCVTPRWDNTARRKRDAVVLHDSTPAQYERWLRHALRRAQANDASLVFVNAWNEWAEGAYLEPDTAFGREYLEATSRALSAGWDDSAQHRSPRESEGRRR